MADNKRVAIVIEGGIVQRIASDSRNIDVYVLDYDSLHAGSIKSAEADPHEDVEYGTRSVDQLLRGWWSDVMLERVEREGRP